MSTSSSSVPISGAGGPGSIAPTPQNTPLTTAPLASALSKPTVPTVEEEDGDSGADAPPETPPGGASALSKLGPAGQSALLGLVQEKLTGLMGRSSGYIEGLPDGTKKRVLALKGVQMKWEDLQLQYKKETVELERKYAALAKPLYDRRLEIITGSSLPTTEELEKGHEQEDKDFADEIYDGEEPSHLPSGPILDTDAGVKDGVPQFWLTTLRNHSGLSDLITDRDEKALEHLTDVRYELLPGPEIGFKLIFEFSPNLFFENTKLEKTYYYQDSLGYEGDFIYDKAEGTEVKWKEDQDLTKEIEIKKQRNKHTNRTRLVRKARTVDSFFNFFSPPTPPTEEQLAAGEFDDDDLELVEAKLEMDYQIGEDFKDRIIPRAIDYFTGKALHYEMEDEDDEYDSEEDSDEDGISGSDEDDDDDDIPPPRKPKGAKGKGGAGAAAAAAGGEPGDCKQG